MPKMKRTLSAFQSVENLELEDKAAEKLRRKETIKDVSRAKAARSQAKIYGHLMETRILLQRALQLQQQQQQQASTVSSSLATTAEEGFKNNQPLIDECDDLLDKLLLARRKLMGFSDPDDGEDDEKKMSLLSDSEYRKCREQWKEILDRRHQDLRLHAGLASASKTQFRVLDSSFWEQVESTVNHEEMRQRSSAESAATMDHRNNYVFDDHKVYQHMLKDFLVIASNNNSDNNNNSTATSNNNNDRSYQRWKSPHAKKQVDRKASKGRKIRYAEIPKLVNFCFPVGARMSGSSTNNLNEDEWFQSLFGGTAAAGQNGKKASSKKKIAKKGTDADCNSDS